MAVYKIADLKVKIEPKFDYSTILMQNYRVNETDFDLDATVTKQNLQDEQKIASGLSANICEFTAIFRKMCHAILNDYDGLFIHSAAIRYNDKAYLFVAPSGTGKTTHIRLWKQLFGDKIKCINGDKPLLRLIDDNFIVYGNPWQGKENYGNNTKAPLGGIFFLQRSNRNYIQEISTANSLARLLGATIKPCNSAEKLKLLSLFEKLFATTPIKILNCNVSKEAVMVAKNSIEGCLK